MASTNLRVPVSSVTKGITMNVVVSGVRVWRVRLWVAIQLWRLGAWVAGIGIKFIEEIDMPPREEQR